MFEYNIVEEGLVSEEYLMSLKNDMDAMRKKDPVGRRVSNQYTGWQSNDGVESRPAWQKLNRVIKNKFNDEVLPFLAVNTMNASINLGNVWANINDKGAWNTPHRHNGCWYSGAFYVHAEGDEGDFVAIDKNEHVLSDFPFSSKQRETYNVAPVTGSLLLFPSGMLHMVQPNQTSKDRYSIAFNTETIRMSMDTAVEDNPDWNRFEVNGLDFSK